MSVKHVVFGVVAITSLVAMAPIANSQNLPKATVKMLKAMHLTGSKIVQNLNQEATAPAALVAAAKREGELDYSSSFQPRIFRKMTEAFHERYPFIRISYSSGNQFARNVKPLLAYREGRVLYDIVDGLGVNLSDYLKDHAAQKLDGIPNMKYVPAEMKDPNGYWVGPRAQYWCMSYNTNRIKKSDLPKTWGDLLTDKKLFNGRIGIVNRPNNNAIMLWGAKGPAWTKNYMDKLFNVVKPQFRKEGSDAVIALAAAGEFDVTFPTSNYRTYGYAKKGAPVAWYCPSPVPLSFSAMIIMNKAPHPNAAKLYINWYLSKEGQLAQFYADKSSPVNKGLSGGRFVVYGKEVKGKPLAIRTPKLLETQMPIVAKLWKKHWNEAMAGQK